MQNRFGPLFKCSLRQLVTEIFLSIFIRTLQIFTNAAIWKQKDKSNIY